MTALSSIPPWRVLVTGSRDWTDLDLVRFALTTAVFQHLPAVVVHGACASGADAIASWWVQQLTRRRYSPLELAEEKYPADWQAPCRPECDHGPRRPGPTGKPVCPAAGSYRNGHMVSLGADVCLAFIDVCREPRCRRPGPHGSHGAEDCAARAEAAGIRTVPYRLWQTAEQLPLLREDI